MTEKSASSIKPRQLSLKEYAQIKEKLAKSKLKLRFPWIIKLCFIIPVIYCLFLLLYYVLQLRFIAEY